jgi:acyl carrier protein
MSERGIERFLVGRKPQTDAEFFRACDLPKHPLSGRIALGVRRVIAALGEVDPGLIHAEDTFDGPLAGLPFWDSLDTVELMMTLEEEFGVEIPVCEAETLKNPDLRPFTVAVFVADVFRLFAPKMIA